MEIEQLPADAQEKAERELNERVSQRSEIIDKLREMIQSENLQGCLADGFLLRFLRARKFNLHNALKSYRDFYRVRMHYPDVFLDLKPSHVQHVFVDKVVAHLPSPREDGSRVLYFRPGAWNPARWTLTDIFRANVVLVEELLLRWPVTQVHGIVILVDLTDFTWRHGVHMINPSFVRRTAQFLQKATPVRVQAVHIYNEPLLFSHIYNSLRPLLKEKMQRRIILHGTSLDSLHSAIPPSLLPSNVRLNGTGPPIPHKKYIDDLVELDDRFRQMNKRTGLARHSSTKADFITNPRKLSSDADRAISLSTGEQDHSL